MDMVEEIEAIKDNTSRFVVKPKPRTGKPLTLNDDEEETEETEQDEMDPKN